MAFRGETDLLWRRFREERGRDTRAALLLAYWPLVQEVAHGVRSKLPPHVEVADMISAGLFGLLSAIERFEPVDGVRFEAFARTRVRGSILDEMRSLDWVPRNVRERARELQETELRLEQKLRRRATQAEVAAALGLTPGEVQSRLARNLLAQVAALDAGPSAEGIEDLDADDPAQALHAAEVRLGVIEAITGLPERERRLLTLHYRGGLTFREIGASLGVSESRVSQLHTQVMRRLRDEIQALIPGEAFPLRVVVEAAAEALERLDPCSAAALA